MRRIGSAVGLTLALAAGCQLIGGIADISFESAGGAGGSGGSGGSGGGGGASCELAKPPSKPDPTLGSGGDETIILALHHIDAGEAPMPGDAPVGLDLDDTCTCPQPNPCRSIDGVDDPDGRLCDGPNGRDNNLRHVLGAFTFVFSSQQISDAAERGKWSILFRISDYNGGPNDDQVRFSVFAAGPFDNDPCRGAGGAGGAGGGGGGGGGGAGAAGGAGGTGSGGGPSEARPRWDGSDVWPVVDGSFAGVVGDANTCVPPVYDLAKFDDPYAYVRDGVLVGSLGEVEFVVSRDETSLHFRLDGGFVSGALQQEGGLWTLSGAQFVGQFSEADQFRALGELSIQGKPVCVHDLAYGPIKTAVCESLDMNTSLPGPTRPCSGTSFGMLVWAIEANIGGTVPDLQPVAQCEPQEHPANDRCDAQAQ